MEGSNKLESAAAEARTGARELSAGLTELESGSAEVKDGMRDLENGLGDGNSGLNDLRSASADVTAQLAGALQALGRTTVATKSDPEFAKAYEQVATASGTLSGKNPQSGAPVKAGYYGFEASIAKAAEQSTVAQKEAKNLFAGVVDLHKGLGDVKQGSAKLASGLEEIYPGLSALGTGLKRTGSGVGSPGQGGSLRGGLGELQSGASTLADKLGAGTVQSEEFGSQFSKVAEKVGSSSGGEGEAAGSNPFGENGQLTGMFDSGYFLLAGIDRSSPAEREASSFAINLDRGGTAIRVIAVPAASAHSGVDETLSPKLERMANEFAPRLAPKPASAGAAR